MVKRPPRQCPTRLPVRISVLRPSVHGRGEAGVQCNNEQREGQGRCTLHNMVAETAADSVSAKGGGGG